MLPRPAVFQFDIFGDLRSKVLDLQLSWSGKVSFDECTKVTPPEPGQTALGFTGPMSRYLVIEIEPVNVENPAHRCGDSTACVQGEVCAC
jgi:hypothetical protein